MGEKITDERETCNFRDGDFFRATKSRARVFISLSQLFAGFIVLENPGAPGERFTHQRRASFAAARKQKKDARDSIRLRAS